MSSLSRSAVLAATACLAVAAAPDGAHAAGLFEFMFGSFARPAPTYDNGPPLDVRVNPYRKHRKLLGNRPGGSEARAKLQTPMDPVKNPRWYLDDPTLRRGDIVVLKGRAVVFDGGRGMRSNDDFTPVQRSTLVSKVDREKIEQMTKGNAGPTTSANAPSAVPIPKDKEASLR